jgi:integrase
MIYKRGKVYWFSFWFNNKRIQKSTKQGNPRVARQIEAAYRTKLSKGEVGITDPKESPVVKGFAEKVFLPRMRDWHKNKPNTVEYYETGIKRLMDFEPLANARLSEVDEALISQYIQRRQSEKKKNEQPYQAATINRHLEVLRRMLRLASEWREIAIVPRIHKLPGERVRERVLTHAEEQAYVAVAMEPLRTIATVLLDTGMRPEEVFRMRFENLHFEPVPNCKFGYIFNPFGKSKNARRNIPMTQRVKALLEFRFESMGKPQEAWVFPADTASGHIDRLKTQHAKAVKASNVKPFVLYSLRHTMLTRLGQSGADPFTIQRIAGHSSITISTRYVHPTPEMVEKAFAGLEHLNEIKNAEAEKQRNQQKVN